MYDSQSPIAVRVCALQEERLDDALIAERLRVAHEVRRALFDGDTTGFRLLNGEGDRLPGLVCDLYGDAAVLRLDGAGPAGFWDLGGIAQWLNDTLGIQLVYSKPRRDSDSSGRVVLGTLAHQSLRFLENGLHFQADIVAGQKSGFFFDQRDNRARFAQFASGKRVLNVFGYTGGFSVYAGCRGAAEVTTVDIAEPAVRVADANWALNNLPASRHEAVAADAFAYLDEAERSGRRWDLIVIDPPSFASSEKQVAQAKQSYEAVFALGLRCLVKGGVIALSSCSSHISPEMFREVCRNALAEARRRGVVLGVYGQPSDHPFPHACPELEYLKFTLLRVE